MKIENISYAVHDVEMIGHLVLPDDAALARPAVLVFPDAGGLGDHAKKRAERLVTEFGYVAFACDLWGKQEKMTDLPTVLARLDPVRKDANKVREITCRAFDALAARKEVDASRIAAIGFCFGGTLSYELAMTGYDLRAAVGFHSGLVVTTPGDARQIKGKILALLGADDPGIPAADRAAFEEMLRGAGVDWQMTLYGGVVHSFTNEDAALLGLPDFARYDAKADARSWNQMANLLAEVLV